MPSWHIGKPPHAPVPGIEGFQVYLGSSVQKTIAFIGIPHDGAPGGIHCTGTAFFMLYEGQSYLVTAKHCVEEYEGREYVVRVNYRDQGSVLLRVVKGTRWFYHPDSRVDVAVAPTSLPTYEGYDIEHLGPSVLLDAEEASTVDVGMICYTVGLFRYITGHTRNTPLVHTGNIALCSEEGIPLWDRVRREVVMRSGALIQTPGIHGASGSPVFVRRPFINPLVDDTLVPESRVWLYGLLASAWFLPPDPELRKEMGAKEGDSLPVGLGIVVQTQRIIEVLNMDEVKGPRDAANAARAASEMPQPLSVTTAGKDRNDQALGDELLRRMLNTPPKPKE